MEYKYKAINANGKKETGVLEARDRPDALILLKSRGLTPVSISGAGKKDGKESKDLLHFEIMGKDIHETKISKKKMLGILDQFAIMMKAAVSLSMCLQVLVDQEKDKKLKQILEEIREDMYSGLTLSSSMAKFKAFEAITINIVAAGEVNGKLDEAFGRAARIMENEVDLTSKVKGALGYPIFLLFLTGIVVIILNLFVLPVFSGLFSQMGADLPALTQMLMASSDFIVHFWYLLFIGIGGAIFLYFLMRRKSPEFREKNRPPCAADPVDRKYPEKIIYLKNIASPRIAC